jgi:hypothetical protein
MSRLALFATAAVLLGQASDPLREVYASAIVDYNAGRINQARTKLEELLKDHPDYFRGYRVYWDAVGRTEDTSARRAGHQHGCRQDARFPICPDSLQRRLYRGVL